MPPSLTRANAVHLRIQGRQCGPLTQDQVKSLVRQGTASSKDAISMDGGQSWVNIGQTSLVKYVPLKRVQGRLQPPIMPDHIDLSFTAEVMALPPPPPEKEASSSSSASASSASSASLQPVSAAASRSQPRSVAALVHQHQRPWMQSAVVGSVCLVVGVLLGLWAGRASVLTDADPSNDHVLPAVPVLRLPEVDRSRSGQVVSIIATLGVAEESAEPAQLPGLSSRRVLVRFHGQDLSILAAIPWRPSEEPAPNTLYVPMSDAGILYNPEKARLSDAQGAAVFKGARVRLTGKVRFKISDVPMAYPILEVTDVQPAGDEK